MRLSRVYVEALPELESELALPKDIAHYLSNVLRLRVGDEVLLFNSEQGEFLAELSSLTKKGAFVKLRELRKPPQDTANARSLNICLLLGLSRGDRMDFAVQKSTELGVEEIVPVYTEHGEVKLKPDRAEKKLQHWRRIAISACEQSGRMTVPLIHPPQELNGAAIRSTPNKWMLEPSGGDKLPDALTQNDLQLLIGPEGGFSPAEISWAKAQGFCIVALGNRILRTETAPIAALAILQHRFGDM